MIPSYPKSDPTQQNLFLCGVKRKIQSSKFRDKIVIYLFDHGGVQSSRTTTRRKRLGISALHQALTLEDNTILPRKNYT
jgi:hypothetical protein